MASAVDRVPRFSKSSLPFEVRPVSRSPTSQAARIRALHTSGMGDVDIATRLQTGLTIVRRVLGTPAGSSAPKPGPAPTVRRRVAILDGPSPVDIHVGRQVRLHRTVAGLSQTQLGEAIGLTFQQVQKYERGSNRISASVLTRIAAILGAPVPAFFAGLAGEMEPQHDEIALRREAIELSRAYERIHDRGLRDALMAVFVELGKQLKEPDHPAAPEATLRGQPMRR